METYQERVCEEYNALVDKVESLTTFIQENATFKTLDDTEQLLLMGQLGAMSAYGVILNLRVKKSNLK